MYVGKCMRACVHAYVTQSLYLLVHAFTRSLHRCESCTRKPCRCSRQALPGRVSLSGNVPTEQPTLALTLCPFRGVLWREPCLFLSLSPVSSLPRVHRLSLSFSRSSPPVEHHPTSTSAFSQSLSRSLAPSLLPYIASFSAPRLESLSTVRAPPHKLPCAPGANTNPCGSLDARRRR